MRSFSVIVLVAVMQGGGEICHGVAEAIVAQRQGVRAARPAKIDPSRLGRKRATEGRG
jgi:hypothetical protein